MNMNSLRTNKNTRKWVLFVLLTFLGQVVLADAHSNMMSSNTAADADAVLQPAVSSTCHGDAAHHPEATTHTSETATTIDKCCDEGCPMTACHPLSAILTSVRLETLGFRNQSSFFLSQAEVIKPTSSLYRPPILG